MSDLGDLIRSNDGFLVRKTLELLRIQEDQPVSPEMEMAARNKMASLSDVFVEVITTSSDSSGETVCFDTCKEQLGEYAAKAARSDRSSGIHLSVALTMMRACESAYLDLVCSLRQNESTHRQDAEIVRDFLTHIEAAYCDEWERAEREEADIEQLLAIESINCLHSANTTRDLVNGFLDMLSERLGFEGVGIRLRKDNDYPYYETRGFTRDFVTAESRLCGRCNDAAGPILAGMCGNVICGRFDSALPFFTARGSFWTNSATELRAKYPEIVQQNHMRNLCHELGYESMALIPLQLGGDRLGLLQINDRRRDRFTLSLISLIEHVADHLAFALSHVRAKDALQEGDERLRLALEAAEMGTWRWDLCTNLHTRDARFNSILGVNEEESTQPIESFLLWIHDDDRERVEESLCASAASREQYVAEFRVVRQDGEIRWVRDQGRAYFEDDGDISHVTGVAVDITEQKRADAQLEEYHCQLERLVEDRTGELARANEKLTREAEKHKRSRDALWGSEQMLKAVLDAIPTRVFWKGEDLKYLGCNRQFAIDAGHKDPDEIIGKDERDLFNAHNAEIYRAGDREVIEEARSRLNREDAITRADGTVGWVKTCKIPLRDRRDRIVGLLGTCEDITASREAAESLHKHAEALERANAAAKQANTALEETVHELEKANEELAKRNNELDEFAYVASHDLQEPLRKLSAFSSLLARDLGTNLPEQAAKDLHFITEAATRMETLVQDLLRLSRSGRAAMKIEKLKLDGCVDRAMDQLAKRVEDTRAIITRDELPAVVADASMVTQVYQNLLGNALKFVEPGQVPEVHLTAEKDDSGWVFGVRDNGIGIEPKHSEQIFSPFKRLNARSNYEGSGIGLSICRKTIERLGGRVWVESQPGEGAHFRFSLGEMEEAECSQ